MSVKKNTLEPVIFELTRIKVHERIRKKIVIHIMRYK